MSISFENVNKSIPQFGEAASRRLSEEEPSIAKRRDAASPGGDFAVSSFDEVTKVAGEEAIDERVLARDDDLGKIVSKVFDPATAAAALPPLGPLEVK